MTLKVRRRIVRIVSYSVAAFLVLGGFTLQLWRDRKQLEQFVEASYQHSFAELVEGVSAIEHALQKELYATSPMLVSQLSNEVARVSAGAQSMMAGLPFSFEELEDTARFLCQVGDWSSSLSRSAASGEGISEEQRETIGMLQSNAGSLAARLVELQSIINEENMQLGALLVSEENLEEDKPDLFRNMFKDFADELSGMPSLVYDGPFSSHVEKSEVKFLANEAEVDENTALQAALSFLDLDENQLSLSHTCEGKIPAYCFTGHVDGGELIVEISRKGGRVLSMLNTANAQGEASLSKEEAIEKADAFLREKGFENMEHSYQQDMGGFLLINYLYMDNGVACYPDLCKVGVSLETGKIIRFECANYLTNHVPDRGLQAASVSAEEAAESALTGGLTLESTREALIPTPRGELHCHELSCVTEDGMHVLIYVNTQTGIEEKILILLESESGTLSI